MEWSPGQLVKISVINHPDDLYYAWTPVDNLYTTEADDVSLPNITPLHIKGIGIVLFTRQAIANQYLLVYVLFGSVVVVFAANELVSIS